MIPLLSLAVCPPFAVVPAVLLYRVLSMHADPSLALLLAECCTFVLLTKHHFLALIPAVCPLLALVLAVCPSLALVLQPSFYSVLPSAPG